MKRTDKWLKMLKECNKWFPTGARYHEKMVGRVWKVTQIQGYETLTPKKYSGSPGQFTRHCLVYLAWYQQIKERTKGQVWGNEVIKIIGRIYSKCILILRKMGRKHSPDIRQIDLDVNRTYRDHIMFRARYNSRQQDLFHVLSAYSVYNTEV